MDRLKRITESRKQHKKAKKEWDEKDPSAESIRQLMRTSVGNKVPHKILMNKDLKKKALRKLINKE